MLTARAEERPGKTAVAAAADDQQVCLISRVEQLLGGVAMPNNRVNADGALRAYSADAVAQCGCRELPEGRLFEHGDRPVRHTSYHDRVHATR